jgi:PAS domain S-box-containing protein
MKTERSPVEESARSPRSEVATRESADERRVVEIVGEEAPDILVAVSVDGSVLFWNRAAEEALGYAREEALGRSFCDLLIPADAKRNATLRDALQETMLTGRATLETVCARKIGATVDLAVSMRAADDVHGCAPPLVVVHMTDVAPPGRARDHHRGEAKLHGLLEAAPDAMVIAGNDGRIVLVNGQAEALFRYSRKELVGQSVDNLVPVRFRGKHPRHRAEYFANPQFRSIGTTRELYGLRKDGTEFPAEISLSPIETEDGLFVSSAIRDVTERRSADEAKFRLAAIVDSSDDAIIGKTLDGVITSWNGGATRLFGYSADDTIGRSISLLVPPGMRDDEKDILEQIRRGVRVDNFDTIRRRKDGQDIDVSVVISPVRDGTGSVVGASNVARDMTGRKRAEAATIHAKEAAEMASRELEAFSYSVAHDLRAPLRSIDGFSLALLEDYSEQLDENGKKYLKTVRESAQYMAQLIDNLLMLARVGRNGVRQDRVDLSALAHAAIARLQRTQPDRRVEVVIAPDLTAIGDAQLLGIVCDNLLGNAWKFTGKRQNGRIEFGRQNERGKEKGPPVYCVRDDGAGFDMAYSDKLFGVFQRLHTVSEFEGIGIGLATVQRIVRRHGGRVWAEGQVDHGATFYFTLHESGKDKRT